MTHFLTSGLRQILRHGSQPKLKQGLRAALIGTAVFGASVPMVTAGLLIPQAASASLPIDFSGLVQQVTPSVVRVNVIKKLSQEEILQQQLPELLKRFFGNSIQIPERKNTGEDHAYGSGFFVTSDGYLLTNNHVIADARSITVTLNDRRELDAELVGTDERTDVAVLKIKGNNFPALNIGNSVTLKVGEPVLAIGSPFGFDYTASAGIVSAKARTMFNENAVPFIQSDVALNPGNSGGPLFNQRGEVIGINSRIFSGTGGYMGLSFSIPIDVAMDVFNQIKTSGKVTRVYLGIIPQDIDRNLAEVYHLPKPEGALITQVKDDTPASRAGLMANDIVLNYDGQAIERSTDLINLINRTRPNTHVPIVVQRDGKLKTLDAYLTAAPDNTPAVNKGTSSTNNGPVLGLRVRDLLPEEKVKLATRLAMTRAGSSQHTQGVVVDLVQAYGLAERAGLQEGDIITRLNNQPTPIIDAFGPILKSLPKTGVVAVNVLRDGVPRVFGMRIEPLDNGLNK